MSSEPSIFFSDVNERQGSFLRRTLVLGGLTGLGVLGLTARLGQLQVERRDVLHGARHGVGRQHRLRDEVARRRARLVLHGIETFRSTDNVENCPEIFERDQKM